MQFRANLFAQMFADSDALLRKRKHKGWIGPAAGTFWCLLLVAHRQTCDLFSPISCSMFPAASVFYTVLMSMTVLLFLFVLSNLLLLYISSSSWFTVFFYHKQSLSVCHTFSCSVFLQNVCQSHRRKCRNNISMFGTHPEDVDNKYWHCYHRSCIIHTWIFISSIWIKIL